MAGMAALFASNACSRRALDPTPIASPTVSLPPAAGSPAPISLKITYTLNATLTTYPVAVWAESGWPSAGAFLKSLQAYPGNFNYSQSYVLPTWWGVDQGRDAPSPIAARPPGTYSVTWKLVDWQGAQEPPGNYVIRVETSNWGLLGTDDTVSVSAPAVPSAIGTNVTAGPTQYFSSLSVETLP